MLPGNDLGQLCVGKVGLTDPPEIRRQVCCFSYRIGGREGGGGGMGEREGVERD